MASKLSQKCFLFPFDHFLASQAIGNCVPVPRRVSHSQTTECMCYRLGGTVCKYKFVYGFLYHFSLLEDRLVHSPAENAICVFITREP